jgi:hypothetical protein
MAKKNKPIIQHQNIDDSGEVTITTDYGAELVIESPVEEDPITGEISKKKEFVGYHAVTGKEVYL